MNLAPATDVPSAHAHLSARQDDAVSFAVAGLEALSIAVDLADPGLSARLARAVADVEDALNPKGHDQAGPAPRAVTDQLGPVALTYRENQILDLIVAGCTNRDIAERPIPAGSFAFVTGTLRLLRAQCATCQRPAYRTAASLKRSGVRPDTAL